MSAFSWFTMHSIAWLSRVEQYDFFFVIVFTVVGFSHSVVKMVCFPSTFQLSHNLFLRCANFLLWCINTEFESLSYNWATRMFSGACWSFAGFTDITVSSTRMPQPITLTLTSLEVQSEHSRHQSGCYNAHDTYCDITPLVQH